MDRPTIVARCAWCGLQQTGQSCPRCGHDLGRAREACACSACRQRVSIVDVQLRDRSGTIACRLRVYDAPAGRRQPIILCTRLDRADRRDGAVALGPEAIVAFAAHHFTPLGRADAPMIERFLWIEGRGEEYALLSFAPNQDERGGIDGWHEAFGTVLRRIPLSLAEVITLSSDASLAKRA